ncbi:hypothetical protein GWI33_014964, partial [Rhynchophorus ferrugineus]
IVLSIVIACVYAGVAPKPQVKPEEAKAEAPSVKSTPLYGQQRDQKQSAEVKPEEVKAAVQPEPSKDPQPKAAEPNGKNGAAPAKH